MRFKVLTRKFPIYTDRLVISTLRKREIVAYTEELKQKYFIEYLDNKSVLHMSDTEIKLKLTSLISTYDKGIDFKYEYRLLIKSNITGEVYGGITIFTIDINNNIEIAYWIKPVHQKKGFATEAVNRVVEFIFNVFSEVKSIRLIIQEDNVESIKLATRCNFKYTGAVKGSYGFNLIYAIWR